jgi:signal transduction histidine kinase
MMSSNGPCECIKSGEDAMNNTRRIKAFIVAMVLAGIAAAGYASFRSHAQHGYLALAVLALAATSSRLKVKLPGINGNMSVNLPFLLTAVVSLSAAEAVLVTAGSTLVQCWPRKNGKFNPQQMTFNLSMMMFATALASLLAQAHWLAAIGSELRTPLSVVLGAAALFLGQTVPVARIVALTEGKPSTKLWRELAQLSFPYYVLSAGVTSMVQASGSHVGWGLTLAVFPVMFGIHRSYRMYFSRMIENMHSEVLIKAAGAGA